MFSFQKGFFFPFKNGQKVPAYPANNLAVAFNKREKKKERNDRFGWLTANRLWFFAFWFYLLRWIELSFTSRLKARKKEDGKGFCNMVFIILRKSKQRTGFTQFVMVYLQKVQLHTNTHFLEYIHTFGPDNKKWRKEAEFPCCSSKLWWTTNNVILNVEKQT